jgi:LSD1 subclass zinc finger protein
LTATDVRAPGADPGFIRTFPCTHCGAKLSFAPGTRELKCEFCGTTNAIAGDDGGPVEELDYEAQLRALEGGAEAAEEQHVQCDKCGAAQNLEAGVFASRCAFCGAAIVSKSYANRRIKPRSIVPFQLDRGRAEEAYRRWIRTRWLAPLDLKRYAQTDAALSGVYLPFWTYDCRTSTDYTGQRGRKHDKTVSWNPVSGHIDHFHDDVVALASRSLPAGLDGTVWRFDTRALVPYKPEYVSGFTAQAYQVGLADGFAAARQMMDERIARLIRTDIGGDDQRIETVRTRYSDITFKHVLMPVWISAYRYRDRVYRYLVNGQTGEVAGQSPIAWWKVALIAIVVLAILYVIFRNQ